MNTSTVNLPQNIIVDLLKELPDEVLQDIFWKVFTESEVQVLSDDEKSDILAAEEQFQRGETIKWENLK